MNKLKIALLAVVLMAQPFSEASIISRLHTATITSGQPLKAVDLNDELNQLLNGHNDQENRLTPIEARFTTGLLNLSNGGTGASTASAARTNLGAAASGANSDITSLTGLTTPLSTGQGGTGLTGFTQGDLLYASSSSVISSLAKNTSSTRYLSNTGTSNNPAWAQVSLSTGVTGNLPVTNLNSGTSASSSTFWRGDGTWAAPAGGAFSSSFTSTNQTLTNSGGLTLAHGLSGTPTLIQTYLKCTTADNGYAVGDTVLMGTNSNDTATSGRELAIWADSTNINVRYGPNVASWRIPNKTTGVVNNITTASWAMVVRAWF